MKNKILLKSFLILILTVIFGVQVYASEVTGDLSSSITQNGSGSEVGGTLGNGTIAGTVGGGSTSSGGGSSGSNQNTEGQVLGASTENQGQVLGATYTPGFPITGLGFEFTPGVIGLIGLILSIITLMVYSYRRMRINA